ncbi:hypothetical protein BDW60DRAFT_44051 [Aspergillus nidulans var. acristatus]
MKITTSTVQLIFVASECLLQDTPDPFEQWLTIHEPSVSKILWIRGGAGHSEHILSGLSSVWLLKPIALRCLISSAPERMKETISSIIHRSKRILSTPSIIPE